MESRSNQSPLVVIVGQTASGKSALAMDLARRFNGEIIAADSRTVYRGMDIGTAKPSREDQQLIPHHLVDVTTPDNVFTVADFKSHAEREVGQITKRGKLPIMVGGSGLYIDSFLYNFSFRGVHDVLERDRLQQLSVEELQRIMRECGIDQPTDPKNPRHLVNAILHGGVLREEKELRPRTLLIGIDIAKEELAARVRQRTATMMQNGLESEVRGLVDLYGWSGQLPESIGYQDFRPFFDGLASIETVKDSIIRRTMQYAKRQKTWFKRNKDIIWISKADDAVDLVTTFLNK